MIWIIGIVLFLIVLTLVLPIWSVQLKAQPNEGWQTISSYQIFWFANTTLSEYKNCGTPHRMFISFWW